MTVRQKRRMKRRIQRTFAWAIFYAFEIVFALVPAALISTIVIPIAMESRGYFAIGGEWLAVLATFYIAYVFIHKRACDILFREEE